MALPTYVGSGAFGSSASTLTPGWPAQARQADDIALLVVESENQTISLSSAQSFVEVLNSPQGTGAAGSAGSTRLAVYWRRLSGAADTAPTIADAGDHVTGQLHVFRGVVTSGDPWNVTAGGVDTTSDTSGSIPGTTTTVDDCLVVLLCSSSRNGTGTAEFSGYTNADLANILERTDNTNTVGLGGGHGMATGEKASAGAYGVTAVTLANASLKAMLSIALKGAPTAVTGSGALGATASIAATALLAFVGSGALTVPVPSLSGTGALIENRTATGALTVPQPVVGGSATLVFTGSGALLVPSSVVAGTGNTVFNVTGTGALTITPPVVEGSGTTTQASVTGSGDLTVAPPDVSGTGVLEFSGTGAATVTAPSISGAGLGVFVATGGLGVPVTISGSGLQAFLGSGTLVVPAPRVQGGEVVFGTAIAIHSLTVALPTTHSQTVAVRRYHGSSVMDTYTTANGNIRTANGYIRTSQGPMV